MKILFVNFYTREIYNAIETYADNRQDRSKYDAILEAVTERANELIEIDETAKKEKAR